MNLELYFLATIFIILIVGLIYFLIKDFKEIVYGIINLCKPDFFTPITWIISPIWLIGYALDKFFKTNIIDKQDDNDSNGLEEYNYKTKLQVDFSIGDKIIISSTSQKHTESLIKDFLEFCDGHLTFENFKITNKTYIAIHCPSKITFYDFSILTQHFCNNSKKSWGIYKTKNLKYYSYSDEKTEHNIVGQTQDGQKFSIYTLADLYNNQYLRLNQKLNIKKFDWNLINNGVQHGLL